MTDMAAPGAVSAPEGATKVTIPDMEKRLALGAWEEAMAARRKAKRDEIDAIHAKYAAMPEVALADDIDVLEARWGGQSAKDGFQRCAKSGLVLLDDDQVLEDAETGETYLRTALGLPLRKEEPDESEDEDFVDEIAVDQEWVEASTGYSARVVQVTRHASLTGERSTTITFTVDTGTGDAVRSFSESDFRSQFVRGTEYHSEAAA